MKYILIAGIAILAVFIVILAMIPKGIEPLTELYFENHTKLPAYIFLDKIYNFSFTVHNLEYQDVEYNYTIEAYDVNNTLLFEVDKGTFSLSDNETKTINENYLFDKSFDRAKLEIVINKNLIGEPEFKKKFWWPDPNYPYKIDIHFWVEEIKGPIITIVP